MRRQVYPGMVNAGKMKDIEADHQIRAMASIVATLVGIKAIAQGEFRIAEAVPNRDLFN